MKTGNHKYKFGIIAGVSSDTQAQEHKASIPDQIETCRRAIREWGGEEIACYVMDGYSRTGYDGLSDAMEDIPPLKEAIEAAGRDEYNVLIMDHFDRLGDLGKMIHNRFKRYRKQLYSARESGRLQDPSTYDPYNDEATDMLISMQGIKQNYRINKLRRGWNVGIPKRIKDGLPPFRVPFGYTRIDNKTPPVKNDLVIHVTRLKDWLFEGRSLSWMAEQLTAEGVPPPNKRNKRWHVESIRHILLNPFYAGIVAIGQKRYEAGKKGRVYRHRTQRNEWTSDKGKHIPLWDEQTLRAIQNEFDRRLGLKNYAKVVYPLAGIMRCTECKQKLIRRHISRGGILMPGLGCKSGDAHVIISYEYAIRTLSETLQQDLKERQNNPISKQDEEKQLRDELSAIEARRAQIHDDREQGLYRLEEALPRIQALEQQEYSIQQKLMELEKFEQTRAESQIIIDGLSDVEDVQAWVDVITEGDPAVVNRMLSALCEAVWVTPDHRMKIKFRT